jgi:RNA polymerase sigma-70 factor (ECF subfamily)
MNTTSPSLLERLRAPAGAGAWERFVQLYTPLIFHWGRQAGLPVQDAADLVQEVLTVLVQKLPEFTYDPRKSFRGWLRTVTLNKWRDWCRRPGLTPRDRGNVALLDTAGPDTTTAFEEGEYRRRLVQQAMQLIEAEFQPATWKACWEFLAMGRPAAEVAREMGISVNAVYLAKSRILARLRQELDGLLD